MRGAVVVVVAVAGCRALVEGGASSSGASAACVVIGGREEAKKGAKRADRSTVGRVVGYRAVLCRGLGGAKLWGLWNVLVGGSSWRSYIGSNKHQALNESRPLDIPPTATSQNTPTSGADSPSPSPLHSSHAPRISLHRQALRRTGSWGSFPPPGLGFVGVEWQSSNPSFSSPEG